jgi:drug/metabolite transporter (DMT)-like permease
VRPVRNNWRIVRWQAVPGGAIRPGVGVPAAAVRPLRGAALPSSACGTPETWIWRYAVAPALPAFPVSDASPPSSALLRAALLMVVSASMFGCMAIAIRLASGQLHPFQIAFFRSFFGAVFALPLLLRQGPAILLRTDRLGFYVLRCAIGMVSMLAGFWAIVHLPLAQAIALSYASPLFVTIGAALVLGEMVRLRRWSAVIIGFIGVLVIVRPGTDGFVAGSLVALLAAACSGTVTISIKFLTRSEPADRIVLLTTLIWVPLSLPAALLVWQWPAWQIWPWVILAGALGTAGHYFWTRALHLADASFIAPISYLQLLVVVPLAWLLFGEVIDRWTALGAAIVVAANIYIARREAKLARVKRDAPVATIEPPV